MSQQKLSRTKVVLEPSVSGHDRKKSDMSGHSFSRMRVRKQSYGFSGISGVGQQRRGSQVGLEYKRPTLLYLNTYQLEPFVKFHVPHVTEAINDVLDSFYSDFKYNGTDAPAKAMTIADKVMRTVKDLNFNRYRIISVVTLAQKKAQCYNNAVAFLWDHEFDNLADVQREDSWSFIQVTCFGVYLD